ncbi:MAG: Rrf2 family transcriptional regulator [Candidatus Omnitrophota bacterium]
MKFIVRDTDYAIRALVYMAKAFKKNKQKMVTVDEIVKEEGLPERFLRRLLQKLAKKGIVKSFKGKAGGFSFSILPSKIKLTDIITIFQGRVDLTSCFLKGSICPDIKRCALKKKLGKLTETLNKELEKITISSLLYRRI